MPCIDLYWLFMCISIQLSRALSRLFSGLAAHQGLKGVLAAAGIDAAELLGAGGHRLARLQCHLLLLHLGPLLAGCCGPVRRDDQSSN